MGVMGVDHASAQDDYYDYGDMSIIREDMYYGNADDDEDLTEIAGIKDENIFTRELNPSEADTICRHIKMSQKVLKELNKYSKSYNDCKKKIAQLKDPQRHEYMSNGFSIKKMFVNVVVYFLLVMVLGLIGGKTIASGYVPYMLPRLILMLLTLYYTPIGGIYSIICYVKAKLTFSSFLDSVGYGAYAGLLGVQETREAFEEYYFDFLLFDSKLGMILIVAGFILQQVIFNMFGRISHNSQVDGNKAEDAKIIQQCEADMESYKRGYDACFRMNKQYIVCFPKAFRNKKALHDILSSLTERRASTLKEAFQQVPVEHKSRV